jgi:hypothetical protein
MKAKVYVLNPLRFPGVIATAHVLVFPAGCSFCSGLRTVIRKDITCTLTRASNKNVNDFCESQF